jgi:tetratricopeptide (TPR) repeat protein
MKIAAMALCARVVGSSSSSTRRRGVALKNNSENAKKIFKKKKRGGVRLITNSSSFSGQGGGSGEEEEEEKEKGEEKLVIVTSENAQYLNSTMMQKRNEVEEYLQKCDALELTLQIALASEDYEQAVKIKKELEPTADDDDDINFSMLCDLCRRVNYPVSPTANETDEDVIATAAKKLGLVGDPRALPALARALRMPTVSAKAHAQIEQSMWTLFGKSGDTELDLLLQKGQDIMHNKYVTPRLGGEVEQNDKNTVVEKEGNEESAFTKEKKSKRNAIEEQAAERMRNLKKATNIFTTVIEKSNGLFAEAWNQRATALYLQGDFAAAYADAEEAFRLNPYHFGARSGMGLCKFASRSFDEALALFESTLEINPHIESIQRYSKELRKAQATPRVEPQKLSDAIEDFKRSLAESSDLFKDDNPETPEM